MAVKIHYFDVSQLFRFEFFVVRIGQVSYLGTVFVPQWQVYNFS